MKSAKITSHCSEIECILKCHAANIGPTVETEKCTFEADICCLAPDKSVFDTMMEMVKQKNSDNSIHANSKNAVH